MNGEENRGTNIPVVSESSPLLSGNSVEAVTDAKDVTVELGGFASGDSASITEPSDKESIGKLLTQTDEQPIPSSSRLYTRQESVPKVSFILGQFIFVILCVLCHYI